MITKLSFEELFTIARSMEKDGFDFYTLASRQTKVPQLSEIFAKLASWESRHIDAINAIEADCACMEVETRDPMTEIAEYIHAVVKGSIFNINKSAEQQVKKISTERELFNYACELEKKSILFYTGLRLSLPKAAYEAVDKLISEETKHLAFLNEKMSKLA
jgi:rubrerythrin